MNIFIAEIFVGLCMVISIWLGYTTYKGDEKNEKDNCKNEKRNYADSDARINNASIVRKG